MEYPELKRELHAQYERIRPGVVLIENKGLGQAADPGADRAARRLAQSGWRPPGPEGGGLP
jgi:hypothetical protein